MADVKIVVEEKLGGQVAFGGKEIRVLKATYEAVPEEKRHEFDEVLIKAQERYQGLVAEVKATGARPQASKLKAQAINEVINPFMESHSVAKGSVKRSETRVIKPTVTRESQKTKEAESSTDEDSLKEEFDDFPTDLLDDSSEEVEAKPKGDFDDLEDELGLDDVLADGDEEIFGEDSEKDPFGGSDPFGSSDPFDDIDLDI